MSVVLAEAVGSEGRVVAVDNASRDYGSPIKLGEATDLIKASPIGSRVEFRFEYDLLTQPLTEEFDFGVLAHASWYFASSDQLSATLHELRRVCRRLCFAEWDLAPRTFDQVPHMLAAIVQGGGHASHAQAEANIRTPLSRSQATRLMVEAGWMIITEHTVDSSSLEDGDWEIAMSRSADLSIESPVADLLEAQREVLRLLAKERGNASLHTYTVVAER